MNDLVKIICDYEKARKAVQDLTKKRAILINSCTGPENLCGSDDFEFSTPGFGSACFEYSMLNTNGDFYDRITFDDNIECHGCDSCREARGIFKGQEKYDLGVAKRKLSSIGKRLIKETNHE